MSDPATELEKLRAELAATKAELAQARAVVSTSEAMIAGLKLEIALLRRETYGHGAERTARLIDQLELQLEELVTDAAEDAIRAEKTTKVAAFERKKPVRKPFPEHLPRERVVVESMVRLSKQLGLTVIAEGVEDDLQLEATRLAGCDVVQGYRVAAAMNETALAAFCTSWQKGLIID
jgi:hypothetical protein